MILVVGGAGYIGSHVVKKLVETKPIVVLDNLSTGHRHLVDKRAVFVHGDLGDRTTLVRIFEKYPIDAVMHFAANSLVGESVVEPMKYYKNNVAATLTLLETMMEYGVKRFIFSSTAAVYGIPNVDLITEDCPTNPINPYGRSKLMIEHMLSDFASAYDLRYVVLRYFNAAGAHESGEIGEDHHPETHLIPLILQHLLGLRDKISVFGTDYDTPDGTCIRDYIHVTDLAEAHILALHALLSDEKKTATYNLGNGLGYSVKEVIDMCERVTGKQATIEYTERRPGDPARLVASSEKIARELGWKATRSLEDIIASAWLWHRKQK
ncbi:MULTISPECIES: UDP-glucose 4-epimerase GalE [Anoxybacillus]|uniref:UDP-glucose 4-epimerase n=2 Tax=Bacilli TaxID=91061 RepID=A0A178TAA4_9BACL|nr:UDP-glucose 4-epimerase GalE [Anoxybacillus flavithermus]ASA96993.1 UDP-glucose 4-epimerase GalE [Anoxybacillus flavithermus]ELK20836.1 UDP-glucose 4-epimerase [Anoxybacillus flavithermus TNO-09.006]MBE2904864.1 UDP-glucose 4-epimerase GalE [Anoxybacillus flavithermus]MBE2908804.1 UDP-glucose 4-epimerase GalE [Anoxybacillus flavithermus]MBE2911174.1 UDP-glucose 4-epimerase GalE [Anoxybacillus flavithermus]